MNQPEDNDNFQPGQLGVRHLLGAMAVVCVVAGLSASQLRTMPPWRSAAVAGHWLIVAAIAGTIYCRYSFLRRRNRQAAGELLLRVLRRPISEGQRGLITLLLTGAVVADGVVISVM